MRAPVLAMGDGALGFWSALREVFPEAREQRCWFHQIVNVLSALPKSAHPGAKKALAEIWNAEDKDHARAAAKSFQDAYGAKFPKVVDKFRSRKLVYALGRHNMVGSMGRVGAAGDNAAWRASSPLLQKNVLNRRRWDTRDQLRIAIVNWISGPTKDARRQEALGRLTPVEFETIMTTPATQAA